MIHVNMCPWQALGKMFAISVKVEGRPTGVGHTQTMVQGTHTELGRYPGPGGFSREHLGAEIFIVYCVVPSTFCNTPCCSFHRSWTLSRSIRGAPPQGAESSARGRPGGLPESSCGAGRGCAPREERST